MESEFRNVITLDATDVELMNQWKELHLEWLHSNDLWEIADQNQLETPIASITDKGGLIFGIVIEDILICSVAIKPINTRRYEIMKMAVSPKYRKKGLGQTLLSHVIDYSINTMKTTKYIDREIGTGTGAGLELGCATGNEVGVLQLDSSSKLQSALVLYKKHGFVGVYEGTDVYMERTLDLR